jgi:site-specific DNA-methyltransferase (adenine-specific)
MQKDDLKTIKEKSKLSKEEWKEYTKTVWSIANVSHPNHPAVFPEEIPLRLIKMFSFVDEIVLDPFGGTGTTASVALSLKRNAISIDQNPEYVAIAKNLCETKSDNGVNAQIKEGDAQDLSHIKKDSISLIVTSPPYWDKAEYGGNGTNIGQRASYASFLRNMKTVFEECYRVLQPGRKICIVTANVNQHTDHGLLSFPISSDFCVLLREIGFVMINEIIWSKDKTGGKWGSANGQRPIFGSYPYPPNFLFKNVHEYILIFSKPDNKKRAGATIRNYREIMELSA